MFEVPDVMLSPALMPSAVKVVEVTPVKPPVAAMVMLPVPFVMLIPEPAVKVALVKVLPVVLPINNCPLVYVVWPVPPLATGKVPVTPVVSGSPVALVSVAAEGVPRFGVVNAGEVDKTTLPVPVLVVTPVPPFATETGSVG